LANPNWPANVSYHYVQIDNSNQMSLMANQNDPSFVYMLPNEFGPSLMPRDFLLLCIFHSFYVILSIRSSSPRMQESCVFSNQFGPLNFPPPHLLTFYGCARVQGHVALTNISNSIPLYQVSRALTSSNVSKMSMAKFTCEINFLRQGRFFS
jgi:hypothetical protein